MLVQLRSTSAVPARARPRVEADRLDHPGRHGEGGRQGRGPARRRRQRHHRQQGSRALPGGRAGVAGHEVAPRLHGDPDAHRASSCSCRSKASSASTTRSRSGDPDYPNADKVTVADDVERHLRLPRLHPGQPAVPGPRSSRSPSGHWTDDELLQYAFALPVVCDPGACFHYAHTNFILLGNVIQKITGKSVTELIHKVPRPARDDPDEDHQAARHPGAGAARLHRRARRSTRSRRDGARRGASATA